jgi:hypothetical protein
MYTRKEKRKDQLYFIIGSYYFFGSFGWQGDCEGIPQKRHGDGERNYELLNF